MLEKLVLQSTWRLSESSFEWKGALLTVEICVLCGLQFSNQFEIVSETPFSCDAVGCELYFARCCALKRTGTFASESKVMCIYFYFNKEVMFCCLAFTTSVSRSTITLSLRKVEFSK